MKNKKLQKENLYEEESKRYKKVKKFSFTGAFTMIGLGVGLFLYALGYNSIIIGATLFIGMGIGMIIDAIIVLKSKNSKN